ncbi:alpha/beta fold hydrolase [Simiduia litorea]|uniref:hypothetical protein n=1 Tax=Simiduia litorea TaxID=1435348 RepID=UPI0036F3A8D7
MKKIHAKTLQYKRYNNLLVELMKHWWVIVIAITASTSHFTHADSIFDDSRKRAIPVDITYPQARVLCSKKNLCPVAFLSAGYGVSHNQYTFLSEQLSTLGYLVLAVGHELPEDPRLSATGNLYETRQENWRRGAETLAFLRKSLAEEFEGYDFNRLLLIGHSNGGDISAWFAGEDNSFIAALITLDHRRVPLPRSKNLCVLTIRAGDFPADVDVLPSAEEVADHGIKVIEIESAKHNDLTDLGPAWLKSDISEFIREFLSKPACVN